MLDVAIAIGVIVTYLTMVQDRVTLGRFSFAGSDVPAMLTVILLLIRFRPRWERSDETVAVLWVVIGFLASLGWNAFLHPFLFRLFMPFRATRTPARWAVIAYVGLAVLAAIGYGALKTRWKPLLLALAIVEVIPTIKWDHLDPRVAPVYTWLAQAKPGVVLELPIIAPGVPYEYILADSVHRQPIVNGASGWETPLHETLRKKEEALQYDDAFVNAADVVIVHESRLTAEQKAALAPMLARLVPLRRFGSDAVFRARLAPAGTASAPRESPRR